MHADPWQVLSLKTSQAVPVSNSSHGDMGIVLDTKSS